MVIGILLPSSRDVRHLRKLIPPLHIYKSKNLLEGRAAAPALRAAFETHSALFLRARSTADAVKVSVEYKDVVSRFEIFDLTFKGPIPLTPHLAEVAVFENWDRIDCIVAFEWLRPASPNEVPPSWDQSLYQRGLRSDILDTATAVGVSMVGVLFRATGGQQSGCMIYTDQDDPCSLLISRNAADIREITANCEIVALQDFAEWKRDLKKWRGVFGTVRADTIPRPGR